MFDSSAAVETAQILEFPKMKDSDGYSYEQLQIENGNYAQIINPVLEILAKTRLNGAQYAVIMFVLRKTYGWHKKEDRISLSQVIEGTDLSKTAASEALQRLVDARILKRDSQRSPMRFNKYHTQWDLKKLVASKDRDSTKTESDVRDSTYVETQDSTIVESKIQQSLNQQYIDININKSISSCSGEHDSGYDHEPALCDHPIAIGKPGHQNPDCYPQKTTHQLQDENVSAAREMVKSGKSWLDLPQRLKVAAVFSSYNKRFGKKPGKGAFMENGNLNPAGENCLKRIQEGITLETFNLVFDFGADMASRYKSGVIDPKDDRYFDAELWANKRPIETIMRKENFHKYRSAAEDWEESHQ